MSDVIEATAMPLVKTSEQTQYYLNPALYEHTKKIAGMFSQSNLVPQHFRDKPQECFIVVQMAFRMEMDPFMMLQNTYVVGGKPGMEAKLVIALINSSGKFRGPLRYDMSGQGDNYGCTAWTIDKESGDRLEARVEMAMAKAEGWIKNPKWSSMRDQMLRYRAATMFGRLYCPERLMGMQTKEELEDVTGLPGHVVEAEALRPSGIAAQLLEEKPAGPAFDFTKHTQDADPAPVTKAKRTTKQAAVQPELAPDANPGSLTPEEIEEYNAALERDSQ